MRIGDDPLPPKIASPVANTRRLTSLRIRHRIWGSVQHRTFAFHKNTPDNNRTGRRFPRTALDHYIVRLGTDGHASGTVGDQHAAQ